MQLADALEFGHDDRQHVYEYVEAHGAPAPETVRDELALDPAAFEHHVAILRRDGLIESVDDTLRVAFEAGAEEEHRDDEVAFTIRPARQEDLAGIVGAIRQVTAEGTYVEAETVAQEIDHQEALLRHNEIESRMFFVACVNSEVVGWVHLHAPELEKLAHTAELTVGVLEEYQGHGIGSHLLERGLEWAASNGKERVYQTTPATNQRVIEWLERRGWDVEAVREDHYRIGEEYVDEVMMAVEL